MRILSVANCPAREHLGSGYAIAGYVNGLRALGHHVDLLEPDDFEVWRWMRPRANGYRHAAGMLLASRKHLRAGTYDLVEFWGGEAWLAIRRLVAAGGRRPLIVQHTNGPEPRYSAMLEAAGVLKYSPLQRWHAYALVPDAFRLADGIVTVSGYDLEWLAKQGLPRSGKRIALEVPLADAFIARPYRERESRVLGFCGSWIPRKGLDVLIPDVTRLLREFHDWRFLVLGAGGAEEVQRAFPDPALRSRIEVVPMIRDKEALARLYERVEIFVSPSVSESFGVALAEAMACGAAPVATRVGFAASLRDRREALLLEAPAAPPQLYNAVRTLILDGQLRRAIAAAARERVQGLQWSAAVGRLAEVYEGWLREHRP
jgi:glycosyltransferase involved in cell wall biosynthesis